MMMSFTCALAHLASATVVLVEVKPWLLADARDADVAISALELACGRPVMLVAREPCGCVRISGMRDAELRAVSALDLDTLTWKAVTVDFARPPVPLRTPTTSVALADGSRPRKLPS